MTSEAPHTDHAITASSLYGASTEPTYGGVLSFLRRRYTRDLTGADVVVSGVPFDLATTHRPGTRFGPAAVRRASAHLAWSQPWPWPADPFERLAVIDWGDAFFDPGRPETIAAAIESHAAHLLAAGKTLLTLGGDHFISHPLLKAHAAHHGPLALLHFDAHSDTWREDAQRIDHGTMFWHAVDQGLVLPEHSVQVGIRTHNPETHGLTVLPAAWVMEHGAEAAARRIKAVIGDRRTYFSFDIDCLDPAYAPGTGTPVPGGLTSLMALEILRRLVDIDFVAMDVVEVCPAYDVSDITALAAATVAAEWLCLLAERRRSGAWKTDGQGGRQ